MDHTCSMHGVVQKCISLENLIRKYEGIYYRRLEDNITNKGIMRGSYGAELGSVFGVLYLCTLFLAVRRQFRHRHRCY